MERPGYLVLPKSAVVRIVRKTLPVTMDLVRSRVGEAPGWAGSGTRLSRTGSTADAMEKPSRQGAAASARCAASRASCGDEIWRGA